MSTQRVTSVPWRDLPRPRQVLVAVLLLLPVLGMVAVPLYARATPELAGVPFFYWYQFAWVPLSIACMWGALRLSRPRR